MIFERYPDVSRGTGPTKIVFKTLALIGHMLGYRL
jgi:hypothetical protein